MKQKILSRLPGDFPWADRLQWFDTIDSTNTRLKALALQGAPHGTILIADHQTGGRGRMGRSFHSPEGMGIYMSILLRPECPPDRLMHLTCAAAVAMCDAVEKSCGFRPGIKWTNDLVVGRKKLAGVLTELVFDSSRNVAAVIGVGLNCCQGHEDFPEEIRSIATSLAQVTASSPDRASIAGAMAEAFRKMDAELFCAKADTLARYRENCITLGKDISLVRGDEIFHGHALDVDDAGALIVRFPDGHTEAVSSGEVSVRGMYGYL